MVRTVLKLHTSNSSQNPCLGFSELSATLLSSRTRFSMLAAFILVALNGCRCNVGTGKLSLSAQQIHYKFKKGYGNNIFRWFELSSILQHVHSFT